MRRIWQFGDDARLSLRLGKTGSLPRGGGTRVEKEEKGWPRLGLARVRVQACARKEKLHGGRDGDGCTRSLELPQPSLRQGYCAHSADENTEAQFLW